MTVIQKGLLLRDNLLFGSHRANLRQKFETFKNNHMGTRKVNGQFSIDSQDHIRTSGSNARDDSPNSEWLPRAIQSVMGMGY